MIILYIIILYLHIEIIKSTYLYITSSKNNSVYLSICPSLCLFPPFEAATPASKSASWLLAKHWNKTSFKALGKSFPLMIFLEKRWFDEWKWCFILGASLSSDSCILSTKALGPIVGLKSWNSAFGRPKQEHALDIDHPLLEQGGNRIRIECPGEKKTWKG